MKHPPSLPLLLFTVILMDLLVGMEFDLFVPSFPDIQHAFHLSPFWVETLLSVNFIGFCGSLFVVGSLADHYGRRPIILLGLGLFIVGSALCLWGPYFSYILCGRLLQGIGIAAPFILSFLIIADSYPLHQQQRLMAILNAVMNTAAAIAPVLGSYVALYMHWYGNFSLLFCLGIIVLCLAYVVVPHYPLSPQKHSLSWRGYVTILHPPTLRAIILHFLCMFVPYWIFVGISPVLYMRDLGIDLRHFGYYQGSLALTYALGCTLFSTVTQRVSQRTLLFASAIIFCLSLGGICLLSIQHHADPLWITLVMIVFVIGQILPSIILYPICLDILPQAKGRVSAIIQGGRLILSALSLQIAGYFYQHSFRNIGILLGIFILLSIVTLFHVIGMITPREKERGK